MSERNIADDDDLEDVLNSRAGWDTDMNRWFELIVFNVVSENGFDHMHEMNSGEIHYEFNPEVFVDMINDAIASDAQRWKHDWTTGIREPVPNEAPRVGRRYTWSTGRRYTYSYDWEVLSMYEGMAGFRQSCIEDVEERGGMYADRIE